MMRGSSGSVMVFVLLLVKANKWLNVFLSLFLFPQFFLSSPRIVKREARLVEKEALAQA